MRDEVRCRGLASKELGEAERLLFIRCEYAEQKPYIQQNPSGRDGEEVLILPGQPPLRPLMVN